MGVEGQRGELGVLGRCKGRGREAVRGDGSEMRCRGKMRGS